MSSRSSGRHTALFVLSFLALLSETPAQSYQTPIVWQSNTTPSTSGYGRVMARLGDLDGDGVHDLAVHDGYINSTFSAVHILSGATGSPLFALTGSPPQTATSSVFLGHAVGMPDQDGDGVPDILLRYQESVGLLFNFENRIYSGATGAIIRTLPPEAASAAVADYDADGLGDILAGEPAGGSPGTATIYSSFTGLPLLQVTASTGFTNFGSDVAVLGDLNGDGWEEFAVSEAFGGVGGVVWVYSGFDGQVLLSVGGASGEHLGEPITSAGDMDGDGIPDFAATEAVSTHVRVFSGATGALIHDVASPFLATAPSPLCVNFAFDIDGGEDVDGDGVPDLVIGAPGEPDDLNVSRPGRVYILSGASGALTSVAIGLPNTSFSSCGSNPRLGTSVVLLGDVDGDGISDFAAGDPAPPSPTPGYVQCRHGLAGPVEPLRAGNVNAFGTGGIVDVLRVDPGPAGSPTAAVANDRGVTLPINSPFALWMARPPAGPTVAHYVLWGRVSNATTFPPTVLPGGVGSIAVTPQPLLPSAIVLFTLLDSFGGASLAPSPAIPALAPATGNVVLALGGLPVPVTFTLQGVIQDASSPHFGMSVTNALRLQIQ